MINELVEETPIAIAINGINFSVMLASPYDIEDFIVGYLHSERIIKFNRDIHDITVTTNNENIIVNVDIANRCTHHLEQRQRQLKGSTGCGICGTQALEHAFPDLNPLAKAAPYPLKYLQEIKPQLRHWQQLGKNSGALHGAFWLNDQGDILACREDIGRHNALDKLLGHILRTNLSRNNGAILMTSRCSVELVQKTIIAGVNQLVSLASPSAFAFKLAKAHNLHLIHIPKHDHPYLVE